MTGLSVRSLPPDDRFLEAVAGELLAVADDGDLSGYTVLVSSLPLAAELRATLARVAARPLLLPCFDTLRRWAQSAVVPEVDEPLPDSERLLLLQGALHARGWFDEGALWGIAAELGALADELSAASARLPESEAALRDQLEAAYRLRASTPLAFEARVVHEMWHALAGTGRPDAPSAYRMRLAKLADRASRPLMLVLDGPLAERLDEAERAFVEHYAKRYRVRLLVPESRGESAGPLARALAAAWPEPAAALPLVERALQLRAELSASPLSGRLQLVPTVGREAEAEAVAAQVCDWLADGLGRVALVAEDRLTARRVRALLERRQVLVADETGWILSTSRAAATIDALLETRASETYFRDVLDLFKSPMLFAEFPPEARAEAVLALERAIRRAGVRSGLDGFRRALDALGDEVAQESRRLASLLLDRLEVSLRLLGGRAKPISAWIECLRRALDALDASGALAGDTAGAEVLSLLAQRQDELAANASPFAFSAWRDWLNREFEAASFRDRGIVSPVVMLPRHDVRLRGFSAAVIIGADASRLAASAGGAFFNQAVRRELGLPTREDAERALRRDLELLLSAVPRVVVTWQCEQAGEAQRLAPEFDLLSTLNRLAWGDDLHVAPLPFPEPAPVSVLPSPPSPAAPVVPRERVPLRLSVSAFASLVACPYRFFARHVLRLNELDEVSEVLEKQEYGELVHRSLECFHRGYPAVASMTPEDALRAFSAVVEEVFATAERDNWLALGWRLRWQARLGDYLDWQRRREAEGWRFEAAETRVSTRLPLRDGAEVELHGRIDRTDRKGDGWALLDYKAKTRSALRATLAEDVQLPAYALMRAGVSEVAYLALDDDAIGQVAPPGEPGELARAQGERLQAAIADIRAGASLPAHGIDAVCRHCEIAGLCRRDHVAD